jgi:hypothetical protein
VYVGSSPGAKDLLNTGELHVTSYLATRLPTGQLLYARLWTRRADHWRYTDVTFTAAPIAYYITPTNGATNVSLGRRFSGPPWPTPRRITALRHRRP